MHKRLLSLLSLVVIAAVMAACTGSGPSPTTGNTASTAFWSAFRITGDEAEGFASLESMTKSADAVVLGHFKPATDARTIQGEGAAEDRVTYASVALAVDRVISGNLADTSVPLEFLWSGMGPDAERDAEGWVADHLPDGPVVVFLRAKRGDGEQGLYRPVNSYGLWTTSERGSLDTPLAEENGKVHGPYVDELKGVDTLDGLVAHID